MTIEVTLAIDLAAVGEDETAAAVANRLAQLGGPMSRWQPNVNGAAARATFKFKNQARRDKFVVDALAIPGVSLATSPTELTPDQDGSHRNSTL